ncbi:hypothetical protein VPH35_087488 [Triticum aestivum]
MGSSGGDGSIHVVMFPFLAFGHISPFVELARKLVAAPEMPCGSCCCQPRPTARPTAPSCSRSPSTPPGRSGAPTRCRALRLRKPMDRPAGEAARRQSAVFLRVLRRLHGLPRCPRALPPRPRALPVCPRPHVVPARRRAGLPGRRLHFTYVFTSFHGMSPVYDRTVGGIQDSDAVVVKTCVETEGPCINYLSAQYSKPEPPQRELEERWAKWLSSFPEKAVVFASFGSETFLPTAAVTELLLGLESCNRPFLTVLNFPRGTDTAAEQQHILRHRSVGCFVNHAGLSSIVEGLVAGCRLRLVLLPMKTDQYLKSSTPHKGRDFFMDHTAQKRFADKFVRDFKNLIGP